MKKTEKDRIGIKTYLVTSGKVYREYWRLDKVNLIFSLLLETLVTVSVVVSVYIASRILGQIIISAQNSHATKELYPLVAIQFLMYLVTRFGNSLLIVLNRSMFIRWDKHTTLQLHDKRSQLDADFFEDRHNQKLLNKLDIKGTWAISELAAQLTYMYSNLVKFILVVAVAYQIGLWAVVLLMFAGLPKIYAQMKQSKLQSGIWDTKGDDYHVYYKTLHNLKNEKSLIEVKLYGLKKKLLYEVAGEKLEEFNKEQIKGARQTLGVESLADLTYESSFLAISLYLVKQTVSGTISIANFSFYLGTLGQFNSAVNNLTSITARTGDYILYAKDFFELMKAEPKIVSPEDAIKLEKTEIPTIEFKNVSFAYRSNPKEKILENLNLQLNAGEHLALVGENGAGKTTIIKLLLRLYDVTEGEILVNGINIKELDLDSYWRQIGVLFQDFNRYPFDIQTNIELGRVNKKSTKKEIDRAVQLSNLDPILDKLPKGINTILDNSFEEGVEPSGGQWQRVALARAFYRNSNILILDEPTAAVDANAEYEIFNNIFAHYGDKTALIISHRFSTVKRAQRIVVLDKGRIIEEGSHRELMKSSKLYAEMFTKQAEGYKD